MPTEIKKNRPDDQMTSCFLKLYTPTRACEIIIRNWSAGQPVSLKPASIRSDIIRHPPYYGLSEAYLRLKTAI